jgi:hypothetical protein
MALPRAETAAWRRACRHLYPQWPAVDMNKYTEDCLDEDGVDLLLQMLRYDPNQRISVRRPPRLRCRTNFFVCRVAVPCLPVTAGAVLALSTAQSKSWMCRQSARSSTLGSMTLTWKP